MSDSTPSINRYLTTSSGDGKYKIQIITDGTTTIAHIIENRPNMFGNTEQVVRAEGVARRRKGDRRREEIGVTLALGRAFKEALEAIEGALNREGYTL